VNTFQVYALAGFGAVSAIVVVAVLLWFVFKAAVNKAVDNSAIYRAMASDRDYTTERFKATWESFNNLIAEKGKKR